jgi:hypothetical protein
MSTYWDTIDSALKRLKTAKTVAEVFDICGTQVVPEHSGRSFWPGDGDDMLGALYDAGWHTYRYEAYYYWVLRSPDRTEFLSYTEGDLDPGDNFRCGG